MKTRSLSTAGVVAVAVALAGCSTASTREESLEPETLTLYHIDGGSDLDPAVAWFVDAVAERSGGEITIDVVHGCCGGGVDVEESLVAAVASGQADLGWVGTRVFADLGVEALAALTAPMLIDGYALQQAALETDEAGEALGTLTELDVTGLALVPGSIRYPLTAEEPLESLDDWAGLTVASFHSSQNAASFRALGAEPVDVTFRERDDGIFNGTIGALENSLIMQDLGRETLLPYATVDVGLWPRSSALIAGPASAASSGAVADVLRQAAADVVAQTAKLGELDAAAMTSACVDGARFAHADTGELDAMRDAVAPVWDEIAANAESGPLLEAIVAIADAHDDVPPVIPDGCDGRAPVTPAPSGGATEVVNGRFETVAFTVQQLVDAGISPDEAGNGASRFTLVLEDGDFELIADTTSVCTGQYSVDGDRLSVRTVPSATCGPGGTLFTADFAVDETALTLTDVEAGYDLDEVIFGYAPLTRVG